MTASVKDLIDMKGKTCLITGATGHLGKVMANSLSELGCDLIMIDHPDTNLAKLKSEIISKYKNEVLDIPCDLENSEDINSILEKITAKFEKLDVLINNAAFVGSSDLDGWNTSFEKQTLKTWKRALDVNLTACFQLVQITKKLLVKSSRASIINIGSIYGIFGPDLSIYNDTDMNNPAAYSVSKGGLIQLTRWMSTVLSPNIRVNTISPGGIARNQPKKFVERYKKKTPLNRMGTEEDIIGPVVYLASDLSSYVTGQNLIVDGGWGVW